MYDGISISDPKFSVAIVFSDPDLLKKYFNLGDFTTYRAVYSRCTCAETAASEHFTYGSSDSTSDVWVHSVRSSMVIEKYFDDMLQSVTK